MAFIIEASSLPELLEKIKRLEKDGYSVRGEIVYSTEGKALVMFDD